MASADLPPELLSFACDQTVFWSGAGVSADAPTLAPLGAELTTRALAYAFQPETAELLGCYYRALDWGHTAPRLETVLDVVFRVDGAAALVDLLSDVRQAEPNDVHRFLAAASRQGAKHITTNFDSCLERAGATDVVHVHGSFADDPSGESLGATLARVERGLPLEVRADLDSLLVGGAKLLVFAGYSGSDFFDVDPYLRSLQSGALASTTILWIEHSRLPGVKVVTGLDAAAAKRQLGWLAAAGAEVFFCQAPTIDLLAELANAWHLEPPKNRTGTKPQWRGASQPSNELRRRASLELYLLMGLHREVDRLLESTPTVDESDWNALAHTRWSQGRKQEALEAWRHGLSGPELVEREAAVLWITGRFMKARWVALKAVKETDAKVGTPNEVPFEQQLVMAETLARIWEHMHRFWDVRVFATKKMRLYALAHLPDPADLALQGRPLGTHLVSRIRSARKALGAESEGTWDAIESFGEYEAISASLNYQHGQLRADAERGPVDAERYRRLYRDRITIGATSAAMRVMFIPGAEDVFSLRETLAALKSTDMTRWHRARFMCVAILRRFGPRARRGRRAPPA